jgi:hypothetical protein
MFYDFYEPVLNIDPDMDGSNVRVGVHGVKEVLADLV